MCLLYLPMSVLIVQKIYIQALVVYNMKSVFEKARVCMNNRLSCTLLDDVFLLNLRGHSVIVVVHCVILHRLVSYNCAMP